MIFSETWEEVLSGEKTQTSRLWKDDYFFPSDERDKTIYTHLLSLKAWESGKIRTLYRVGQTLAVQKARGAKGIARIRILELARRDVRTFTDEDFYRETGNETDSRDTLFWLTWLSMHDKPVYKQFSDIQYLKDVLEGREVKRYDALVIRFELIENKGE